MTYIYIVLGEKPYDCERVHLHVEGKMEKVGNTFNQESQFFTLEADIWIL